MPRGRDIMAAAQTGTGKTAGFTLPLLQRLAEKPTGAGRKIRSLVLVPTRELAAQVAESVRTYGAHLSLRCTVIFGGVGMRPQVDALGQVKDGLVGRISDEVDDLGLKLTLMNVHPETNNFTIGANTRQKNWVVLKALEKPFINLLWLGTFILVIGFGVAINRRYSEFQKMKNKGLE